MDAWLIALIIVAIVAVIALGAWMYASRSRSKGLQERFGPEYENVVGEAGRRSGERALREREERVSKLQIKELSPEQLQTFGRDWRNVQTHFVDDPEKSVLEADTLVQKVMDARGYPLTGYDQQMEDISVDHAGVVTNYREAHDIAERCRQHQAGTEDLRQAMIHYRTLFSDLLGEGRMAKAS
jgi:type II secretory pathway pseudopilin PulG